jgi:N-acetyl-anhydromuramyl-L-alanine amidase AmpD
MKKKPEKASDMRDDKKHDKPKVRTNPNVVYRRRSPNQSARTAPVSIIVLHSTESSEVSHSSADLQGIANYFGSTSAQVSAHVITDADGNSARCVSDPGKAWACVSFNSASLNIEQIGHAAQTSWPASQLDETARWIARWHRKHGIPIQRGAVSGVSVTKPGVVTHAQLGSAGGGHTDPGSHYPVDDVLKRAVKFANRKK